MLSQVIEQIGGAFHADQVGHQETTGG
jgi:hypothetical protein